MIRLAGALLLLPLLSTPAFAESVRLFDPPHKDDSPTAFACTAQTLASGAQCTFEGQPGASATASANRERLVAMVPDACQAVVGQAGAGDASALKESCRARLEAAAGSCVREGALLDAQGRFTTQGKSCYRALAEARVQAESLANAAPTCCQCLAEHHCAGAGSSCVSMAARAQLAVSCETDACMASCAELVSNAPVTASSPSSARGKRAK